MSTKTYTLTEDAQGHKIRKCSEYVITDEAGKVKAVSLVSLDGTTPIPLNKNFTAVTSPIVAESYATLISNASQVTDKTITISTDSAKMLSEYCRYRGQQTRNLAFGGSYSGNGVDYGGNDSGVAFAYDNGVFTITDNNKNENKSSSPIFKKGKFSLKAGTYVLKALAKKPTTYTINLSDYNTDKWIVDFSNTDVSFTLAEDTDVYVGSYCLPNTTISISENIQVELGTTATDFVPPLTTATTIQDANAKGFKVCTIANGESYELLPSLYLNGNTHYLYTGVNANSVDSFSIDYTNGTTGGGRNIFGKLNSWADKGRFWISYYADYIGVFGVNCSISTTNGDRVIIDAVRGESITINGKTFSGYTDTLATDAECFVGKVQIGEQIMIMTIHSMFINGTCYTPAQNENGDLGLLCTDTKVFYPKTAK